MTNKIYYFSADESFTVNDNDRDLDPITISLPSPPKLELIDGYGKYPVSQKFTRTEYPARLARLENKIRTNLVLKFEKAKDQVFTEQKYIISLWEELEKLKDDYEKEILWIKKQIYHIVYGYWFFCNGKPTYITGAHYAFLNFWTSPECEHFEYRDRDRRFFLFAQYIWNTTEDETGKDTGSRTFYGFLYPKHRRDGATHKVLCALYFDTLYTIGGHFGIQSFNENNAETHYKNKLRLAWEKFPFFFRPIWKRGDATSEMFWGSTKFGDYPIMNTKITYATTASRKFYEGDTLTALNVEEAGKTTLEDVSERWGVQQQCLGRADGAIIIGKVAFPTTVYELEGSGGKEFKILSDQSRFYERIPGKKQTLSGLARLFIPAYDGLEEYVGEFGESIMDDPTPEQAAFIKRDYGAKFHINQENEMLLRRGDSDSMAKYRERKRLFPTCLSDCFISNTGEMGFDMQILTNRKAELMRLRKQPVVRGNYYWLFNGMSPMTSDQLIKGGHDIKNFNGRIVFEPDSVRGRWETKITKGENKRFRKDGHWFPQSPKYTLGADPFQFSMGQVKASRHAGRSRGGGGIIENRDLSVDPLDKDIKDWITYDLKAYYNYRPASDVEFVADMLAPSIYHGAMIFPETNIRTIVSKLLEWGYGGYLLYAVDSVTGRIKDMPGISTQTRSKEELFQVLNRFIDFRGAKVDFLSFIDDCININSPEEMRFFDGLAAVGCALLGAETAHLTTRQDDLSGGFDAGRAFKKRRYR